MKQEARPNSMRRRVMVACWIIRCFLTLAACLQIFVRARIIGRENVPDYGPVIVTGNHPTIFDPIAVFGALKKRRDVAFMTAAGFFKFWPFGVFLRWLGHIPVARGTDAAIQASETGIWMLGAGACVVVFYEGRTDGGRELLPPKKGVAYMVDKSGAPVVPFAVVGTERVKPPGTGFWRWNFMRRYCIIFGQPIQRPMRQPGQSDTVYRDVITQMYVDRVKDLVTRGRRELGMPPMVLN